MMSILVALVDVLSNAREGKVAGHTTQRPFADLV